MFKNYLKIAFRNLWKHKVFSMINIISLSIGLSAAFVIGMMVYYEYTFDNFHKDGDRMYRVVSNFKSPESTFYNSGVPVPLTQATKKIAALESVSYFYLWYVSKATALGSKVDYENLDKAILTDPEYFEIFEYEWLSGSLTDSFTEPNKVVLTQSRAKEYFPNLDPPSVVGKEILYNEKTPAIIVGVVKDFEARTDIVFNEFVSLATAKQLEGKEDILIGNWDNTNSSTQLFVKTRTNSNLTAIQEQLDRLAKENQDKELVDTYGQTTSFSLQPFSDIHFNPSYGIYDYSQEQADKGILHNLGLVALFLLVLGSINFVNLNTAQASYRAKEIGIRKTLGGSKKQMIFQFLGETFIVTCVAVLVSIGLAFIALGAFEEFVPKGLSMSFMLQPEIILFIILLVVTVTLLSGFYPGVVLSKFKPARVLKSQSSGTTQKNTLRKVLTVSQFAIAQIFIIATVLVGKQIHYMMNKDLGFKKDAIAYIQTPWKDSKVESREIFANELRKIPSLENVSLGGMPPASQSINTNKALMITGNQEHKIDLQFLFADKNYLDVYKIKLLAGRGPLNDTIKEYVLNESAMRALGYQDPDKIIGKQFELNETMVPIVGVMQDFNQHSLRGGIDPMAITGDTNRDWRTQFNKVHISLPMANSDQLKSTLALVKEKFKDVYPDADFDVTFIDEIIARFYSREQRLSTLLNWATGLSVLISCLGLLGLVIHTTERRTKEIGIRKVLGASLAQLNVLLCKDFLMLVGIAFVIAVPLAYWGLYNWLQDFAYKTEMSWWVFVISGVAMVIIALIIMSIRTISTAMKNPVKILKTE